jgi:hypothetical protein
MEARRRKREATMRDEWCECVTGDPGCPFMMISAARDRAVVPGMPAVIAVRGRLDRAKAPSLQVFERDAHVDIGASSCASRACIGSGVALAGGSGGA